MRRVFGRLHGGVDQPGPFWPGEVRMGKSIGFVIVLGLMGLSSWLLTRKSRRILGKALGREIRAGEETSLRAWMDVPDAQLRSAAEEMGRTTPVDAALGAMDTYGRAVRPALGRRADEQDPYTRPNSIR
jgi:hypothetical protein